MARTTAQNIAGYTSLAGFADVDWRRGDTYLAGLIGTMALHHRDHASSYPADMTEKEWQGILTKIGEPLVAYAENLFSVPRPNPERLVADAKAALILFAEHFTSFWD